MAFSRWSVCTSVVTKRIDARVPLAVNDADLGPIDIVFGVGAIGTAGLNPFLIVPFDLLEGGTTVPAGRGFINLIPDAVFGDIIAILVTQAQAHMSPFVNHGRAGHVIGGNVNFARNRL